MGSRYGRPRVIALLAVFPLLMMALVVAEDDAPIESGTGWRDVVTAVDAAQLCYHDRHGRYGNVVDLDETRASRVRHGWETSLMGLAVAAGVRLDVQVSRGGRSYLQRVTGDDVDTYVERRGPDFVDVGPDAWPLPERCPTP